jgi:predicted RNA-binding protein YlxR (DUF448 family)
MAKSLPGPEKRKRPRTCAGCGGESPKKTMLRVVRTPAGEVRVDPTGRENGRGAYLCRNLDCVAAARRKRALSRFLKTDVGDAIYDELEGICAEMSDE